VVLQKRRQRTSAAVRARCRFALRGVGNKGRLDRGADHPRHGAGSGRSRRPFAAIARARTCLCGLTCSSVTGPRQWASR
jgi:hypothetical protein